MKMSLQELIDRLEQIKGEFQDMFGLTPVYLEGIWYHHDRKCIELYDSEARYAPYTGPVEIVYYNGNVQRCQSLSEARDEMRYWAIHNLIFVSQRRDYHELLC